MENSITHQILKLAASAAFVFSVAERSWGAEPKLEMNAAAAALMGLPNVINCAKDKDFLRLYRVPTHEDAPEYYEFEMSPGLSGPNLSMMNREDNASELPLMYNSLYSQAENKDVLYMDGCGGSCSLKITLPKGFLSGTINVGQDFLATVLATYEGDNLVKTTNVVHCKIEK